MSNDFKKLLEGLVVKKVNEGGRQSEWFSMDGSELGKYISEVGDRLTEMQQTTLSVLAAQYYKSLAVEPQMQRRWESQTAESVEAGFASQSLGSAISQSVTLLQKVTAVAVISAGARTK